MAVQLTDNYNRTSNAGPGTATTGQAYTQESGTWGTDGSRLYSVSGVDGNSISITPGTGTSHDAQVKPVIGANQYPGIIVSFVDVLNNYRLEANPDGSGSLIRLINNTNVNLATFSAGAFVSDGIMRLTVDNTSSSTTVLKVYSASTLLGTYNDTTSGRPVGSKVSLRNGYSGSGTCRFDDLQVSDIAATTGRTLTTTNMVTRLRASAISGLANGASVTAWSDVQGNRNLVTRNAAPTFVTSALNSKAAVRFNGSSQDLKMDAAPAQAQPYSIVVVARPAVTNVVQQIMHQGSGGEVTIDSTAKWSSYAGASRLGTVAVTTNAAVFTSVYNSDSGDSQQFVNGAVDVTANVGTGAMTAGLLTVGNHNSATRYYNGDLFEILIYSKVLTAAERAQIHSYVQEEYGITVSDYTSSVAATQSGAASLSATSTLAAAPASGRVVSRWNGTTLVSRVISHWNGTALVSRIVDTLTSTVSGNAGGSGNTGSTGTSVAARWQINSGGTPMVRATYETGVNSNALAQVAWVGSFPDVRARTSRFETGVAAGAQDAYQAYIVDTTTSTTVADSGVVAGTSEKWVASSFTPVAGRRYIGYARVRAASGTWSAYASTRFVAPSGKTLYLEDYGAVGDGTTQSGTDYRNSVYQGPIRNALKAAGPGDVVKSKSPGTVLTALTAAGTTLSSATAVFTAAMVGKKVIIYGAGTTDTSSNSYAHRTTVSAVSGDLKSATLSAAVLTGGTSLTAVVGYAEYVTGHMDIDSGMGGTGAAGGWTLDGTGCVFTSLDVDYSGFRTTIPDVTYRNVHYWQKTQTTRGNGQNNNSGPFFIESTNVVGMRLIGCYAERARDAGFLIYGGPSDIHIVDCVADHTNADGFHVTGSGHDVQFIRPTNIYIGDDAVANIGYRSDGDSARPYNITWESPRLLGQDWGRGVSFGGCYNCLVTDLYMERGAGSSMILGSDGDMANTANVQIRRFTIASPNLRRGQKPTYSQGTGTGSTIPDDPWVKLLNSSSSTRQRDILVEDGTVADGRYIQIISYGSGEFQDGTITFRGINMTGSVNAGTSWLDQGTYPNHINMTGISVPSGSTAASAPTGANS